MIDKRLIGTVSESKKYIVGNVICQWISLAANIGMMVRITRLLAELFQKTADRKSFMITAVTAVIAVMIRFVCAVLSAKLGYFSSKAVKKTLREKIYKKLLRLGTSYREQAQTSEVVQVAVEGVDQLETYFGAYLPQFFYAMLAPLTLFAVLDILEETPLVEEITDKTEVVFHGAKAENVTFAYGDETILADLSVTIPENSVVGIAGRSGSGKSTLLKLFMRFFKVQNGSIRLSDTDVEDISTANLRDIESFVTQETHLFHDSIRNNIRIAKLDATNAEIENACKKAAVHEFIMTLPKGYDTAVGELGDTLSGGERQRIGLARAFLHDAPFMLLDEPTSNLDSLNEAVILKSLHEERRGKTVILVSHRESTMRIADTVYSVEHGRMS